MAEHANGSIEDIVAKTDVEIREAASAEVQALTNAGECEMQKYAARMEKCRTRSPVHQFVDPSTRPVVYSPAQSR